MNVLIVDRQLPFTELAARLHAEGWQREADPTAPPPLIEGEPEIVQFRRADSRLHYHFEPATGMRELRITGPGADNALASLAAHLPGQGIERARQLLRDTQPESRLLGLQMVTALDGHALFEETAALLADANRAVARQALQTCVRLLAAPAELALQSLKQWKQQHPGKSAFFLLAGNSHNKLQILRRLAQERRASNEHIDDVLRTAFGDGDWEVRLTALVVAARLRADGLVDEAVKLRLPEDTADGVNVDERRMLRTIQLCAIELLQGAQVPPMSESAPDSKAAMRDHLLRCLAGEPVRYHEKAFLYLHSLITPLPAEVMAPASLPRGIVRSADGYLLESPALPLCWVPPVEHWLGEELPRLPLPNPIRSVRSGGFFMVREPLASGPCDYATALEQCRGLAAATGLEVRLPGADEWEMAARGPDGRRFPWGNNARSEQRFGESPWGMADAVGRVAQWTSSEQGGDVVVCGGRDQWVCAMRAPAARASLHAVRIVIAS
jgi:hypothetical protein